MQNKSNDNAPRHFNLTARILHWLMAAAILAMLFIGVGMTTSMTWRPWLIDIHRPLGIAILLLVIIRLINRLCYPIPPLPPSVPRWQAFLAHASHWLLYILMFSLPLLGWATLSAGNWPVTLFRLGSSTYSTNQLYALRLVPYSTRNFGLVIICCRYWSSICCIITCMDLSRWRIFEYGFGAFF